VRGREGLSDVRKDGTIPYLRPDGKTQVTIEYQGSRPVRLDTVVVSSQHASDIDLETLLTPDIREHVVQYVLDRLVEDGIKLETEDYRLLVNPTGRFEIGGPMGDAGLTGRKIIIDTYGGMARHGGGAFSGKDPSKADRSAAYAMRWVAKNVVAAGLASRCEVQVAYAIGKAEPVGLFVETFGTATAPQPDIERAISEVFDLHPAAIIRDLDLLRPIYSPDRRLRPLRPRTAGAHVRIAVSGSIATDHLTVLPGRFTDQLIPRQLDHVLCRSSSTTSKYGTAACRQLRLRTRRPRPPTVPDRRGRRRLRAVRGVAQGPRRRHRRRPGLRRAATARFMCTTDQDANQIAAFYTGAMAEARDIDLTALIGDTPAGHGARTDLVLIAPNDPEAMLRHTRQCRELAIPFAADPSQQLARLDGAQVRDLVDGARWLFTDEYESALLLERTGWTRDEVLDRGGTWIVTLGEHGARAERADGTSLHVPAVRDVPVADPTGVGDAFRAGFLAATLRGLDLTAAVRLGCAVAAEAIRTVGSQSYDVIPDRLLAHLTAAYGAEAATAIAPHPAAVAPESPEGGETS
jgi:sugar/nucleoside kinase (ribokinase family)